MAASVVSDPSTFTARASSVLRGNARACGPALMFDGRGDTCWNSDQSSAGQWVELAFRAPVAVAAVALTFQGGFVGQGGRVLVRLAGGGAPAGGWQPLAELEPDDTNARQEFPLPPTPGVAALRVEFDRSTDFYGRVTVYQLEVLG